MAADVITSLTGNLDAELEKARETLKGVDDSIKKLFGKEANELSTFGQRTGVLKRLEYAPTVNAQPGDYKSTPLYEPRKRNTIQSRIVTSAKEKSREEVLAEQREDRPGLTRNRRMFGALLGTLQRFKQDETKLKDKEEKRAQIEAKLEINLKNERETVKKEKQQLIRDRRLKLTEIKRLEIKKLRLDELEHWETQTKHLSNFIRTEAKPHIFYLPKKMNPVMDCRLEQSKQLVAEMIATKRKVVLLDLDNYEQRSKGYWERRLEGRDVRKMEVDPYDVDMEEELREIMKTDEVVNVPEGAEEELPEIVKSEEIEVEAIPVMSEAMEVMDDELPELTQTAGVLNLPGPGVEATTEIMSNLID